MTCKLSLLFISLTFCIIGLAQALNNAEAELLKINQAWAAATKGDEVEKIVPYWDKDAIKFFPGFPPAKGIENMINIIKFNRSKPGFSLSWSPEEAVVVTSGDLGYTYGPFEMSFDGGPIA